MKFLAIFLFLILIFSTPNIYAVKGSFVDSVKFIQYLDENTALEEVKKGNLDMYYYKVSSERIQESSDRKHIQVYESTGGSYSILVNPAESEKFNPFSIREIRFALNYLIDRNLIVNELMGGYGTPMVSNYGYFDADYLSIIRQVEEFNFRYNPAQAEEIISKALLDAGAIKNKVWEKNSTPIEIIVFIRSDDPVRKSIGEILSAELERIGFIVKRDYGDLNKAFVVVYGSNPADLKWNLYTEGWAGRSAFVKYDSLGLGQMYSPWFSNMPGFNDPSYWNYQNEQLDEITQRIYVGNFSTSQERESLIQNATTIAINESVRIFLASKIDQYAVNEKINGIVNDFGAGVPSRFTPINSQSPDNELTIGVKQIYQGSWNPVMGMTDSYSRQIWDLIYDPGTFKHPYTGATIPVRTSWIVDTAGPEGQLDVPIDTVIWDSQKQEWVNVAEGAKATSKITFSMNFSNWHHGIFMDMNDVLYSAYFTLEWGDEKEEDETFDAELTPRANQFVNTLKGIRIIDQNTIEAYVDYWHYDYGEIAEWGSLWTVVPWEINYAMEQAVIDGKLSFSRSGAVSNNLNWMSLILPNDANVIKDYLVEFKEQKKIPNSINENNWQKTEKRYDNAIKWIDKYKHAIISNGPFYLEGYSPEARTITVKAFDDTTYPFSSGEWKEFENPLMPKIKDFKIKDILEKGTKVKFEIETENVSEIQYFVTNSIGKIIDTNIVNIDKNSNHSEIEIKNENLLTEGANEIKIFAISESVSRPDVYSKSFLMVQKGTIVPSPEVSGEELPYLEETNVLAIIGAVIIAIIIIIYLKKKRSIK